MNVSRISAAALAALVTAVTMPAIAHAMDETIVEANTQRKTAYVSYADLKLGNQADVEKLQDRVRRAASRVCLRPGDRSLEATLHGISCRNAAIEKAAPQIAAAVAQSGSEQMAMNTPIAVALP